jgi:predicted anti-sigma-YlaC factor YlaD
MKCMEVYRHICDRLDEEVNSPKCRAIKEHLAKCPGCSAYLDSLKKTVLLYKRAPFPRVPPSVHKDLVKAINLTWLMPASRGRSRKNAPK